MQESDAKKPRGRSAIEAAHGNVTSEDEARLDLMISDLYEVDSDEARKYILTTMLIECLQPLQGDAQKKE